MSSMRRWAWRAASAWMRPPINWPPGFRTSCSWSARHSPIPFRTDEFHNTITAHSRRASRTRDRWARGRARAAACSSFCPAACRPAAHLHLARTVCRRAERLVVELPQEKRRSGGRAVWFTSIGSVILLFVLARAVNQRAGVAGRHLERYLTWHSSDSDATDGKLAGRRRPDHRRPARRRRSGADAGGPRRKRRDDVSHQPRGDRANDRAGRSHRAARALAIAADLTQAGAGRERRRAGGQPVRPPRRSREHGERLRRTPLATLSAAEIEEMIAANLLAPFHAAHASARVMLAQTRR